MQYLREGVLMTEAEENKLHHTSLIKVSASSGGLSSTDSLVQDESEYPILAGKDAWAESRDNLHDHLQTPIKIPQSLVADNEVITKPRHGG